MHGLVVAKTERHPPPSLRGRSVGNTSDLGRGEAPMRTSVRMSDHWTSWSPACPRSADQNPRCDAGCGTSKPADAQKWMARRLHKDQSMGCSYEPQRVVAVACWMAVALVCPAEVLGHDPLDHEIVELTDQLRQNPLNARLLLRRAQRWHSLGNTLQANHDLTRVELIAPENAGAALLRAQIAVHEGDEAAAEAYLSAILRRRLHRPALVLRAQVHEQRGALRWALVDYQAALDMAVTVDTVLAIGRVSTTLGRFDEAILTYRNALLSLEGATEVRLALIAALRRRGQLSEALRELAVLRRSATITARIDLKRADVLREMGRTHEAIQLTERALQQIDARLRTRPSAALLVLRARLLLSLGRTQPARIAAARALRQAPRYPDAQRLAIDLGIGS